MMIGLSKILMDIGNRRRINVHFLKPQHRPQNYVSPGISLALWNCHVPAAQRNFTNLDISHHATYATAWG